MQMARTLEARCGSGTDAAHKHRQTQLRPEEIKVPTKVMAEYCVLLYTSIPTLLAQTLLAHLDLDCFFF